VLDEAYIRRRTLLADLKLDDDLVKTPPYRASPGALWRSTRTEPGVFCPSGDPADAALHDLVELGHVRRMFLSRSQWSTFGVEGAGRITR
jgi:hypothetical protein